MYTTSPKFAGLAPRTKKDYIKVMDYLDDIIGKDDPRKMIKRDVIEAQMANLHRKRFANEIPAMLSRLFEFAINYGWLETNPAKGVERLNTGEGHQPWPDALIEKYAAKATGPDRIILELAIGTGQRIQDILDMRWSDIEGDGINVKQNKTGHELYIPFTRRLSDFLATTPKKALWIAPQMHGQQTHYNTAEQRFRVIRKAIGGEGFVMHGWRYTAAHHLALAGCTDAEIAAITGHKSLEMVAKYSRKASQRGLAERAQKKRN
jgi:integrase